MDSKGTFVRSSSKRRTKAQKKKDYEEALEEIRRKPENERSPMEKYWLAHEHDEYAPLNMRYVLR